MMMQYCTLLLIFLITSLVMFLSLISCSSRESWPDLAHGSIKYLENKLVRAEHEACRH